MSLKAESVSQFWLDAEVKLLTLVCLFLVFQLGGYEETFFRKCKNKKFDT